MFIATLGGVQLDYRMARLSESAQPRTAAQSALCEPDTISGPLRAPSTPFVLLELKVASGFPTTHLKATPPTHARPASPICCCHLLSTRVKSDAWSSPEENSFLLWWMRTVLGEKRMGREERAAKGFFFSSWY